MDDLTARVALPAALGAFLVFAFVWPVARLRRRTGERGVVFARRADPVQGLVGALVGLWLSLVATWTVLVAALGPAAVGVWPAPRALRVAGWALVGFGLGVSVVAQAQMGASWRIGIDSRPTALVTGGLYRAVRNPIY